MNRLTFFALAFLYLPGGGLMAQPGGYHFSRLGTEQGLSHNYVVSILKDSLGFVWFGTSSGLNRYDGYHFRTFKHDARDTNTLASNAVVRLYEGPEGKLWVETRGGTAVFDPRTETFSRRPADLLRAYGLPAAPVSQIVKGRGGRYWFLTPGGIYGYAGPGKPAPHLAPAAGDTTALAGSPVASLAEDRSGALWVMHRDGLLEKVDPARRRVVYRNDALRRQYPGQPLHYQLTLDDDGDAWIFAEENPRGVFYLSPARGRFVHLHKDAPRGRLNTNIVRGVVQDNRGTVWIATDHGGVNLLDKKDFSVTYLLHDPADPKSLGQNSVNTIYKDDAGIVWLGTFRAGVSYYHESLAKFPLYEHRDGDPASLPFNDINRFAEDARGNLWIGTNGGGLLHLDRATGRYRQFRHDPRNPNSLANDIIVSLFVDRDENLWIGTYFGGLDRFDGQTFTHYRHNPRDPNSLADDRVWEIFEDSRRNLWIGTLAGGLDRLDRQTGIFHHLRANEPNSIHTNYVAALTEDRAGNLWVGTGYGLEVRDPRTGRFTHYLAGPEPGRLSNNNVFSVHEDSRGLLWVGTQEGLNLFDRSTNTFRVFRREEGLPDNSVLTILEDDRRHLWLSTPRGLSHLQIGQGAGKDPYAFRFVNYDASDGLQGDEFSENAALRTRRGELAFGGSNGFNLFHPDSLGGDRGAGRVVLTGFQLFNRDVAVGETVNGRTLLAQALGRTGEVVLKPGENVFSIEFAALNFLQPEKVRYSYNLEGFTDEWLAADEQALRAPFTNLNPGTYTFRVRADAGGSEKGNEARLRIVVLPPFWKTKTALFLYIAALLGALLLARRITLARARMNFRLEQERQEARRMHELDLFKIKFFTNVSHEFRTPLTLIITPLEKLTRTVKDPDLQGQLLLIHRNARRLLNLVNQLLDFRKMEEQDIRLQPVEGDIVQFVKDLTGSFSDISEKKRVQLTFEAATAGLHAFFDPDKLEKILFNLLSNAFKFTPEGGTVSVQVDVTGPQAAGGPDTGWVWIRVRDTGIGIPADKHEKVFERFFQHEVPGHLVNQGSGIGLSITREFVKLHGGTITVESTPGAGSVFTVGLPIRTLEGFLPVPASGPEPALTLAEATADDERSAASTEPAAVDGRGRKPSLLLVEDNEDFRFYLKDNLKAHYRIVEAANGKEGWQQATALVPDLIVSDIMMPEMDGLELCRRVRKDKRTSHIPVILLTARAADEQKREGFGIGANDYVTKPFDFEILQARIRNLIAQQEAFRKAFNKGLPVAPGDIQITSLDEKLIAKAIAEVEKNMGNADFSVEDMSHELGMSRVHLYKKLLSLTGKSPLEFIRTVRLKRAAQLLEKSQLTVSEVAYQVGFNNPKYFTKYFKEEFKVLPSQYAAQKQKEG